MDFNKKRLKLAVIFFLMLGFLLSCTAKKDRKLIVLTFDDSVKSHYTMVAPLLKEYDFGATFFITQLWMKDTVNFLTWDEVSKIHKMGFEIGNHSWSHLPFNTPENIDKLSDELLKIENKLAAYNIPKPISFAWPGNQFDTKGIKILHDRGYKLARRGMQPEIEYGKLEHGSLYNPSKHNSLLIPTTGDAYPTWELEYFKSVVDNYEEGKAIILQFHGVPDETHPWVNTDPQKFKQFMAYLKENDFTVIALGDLRTYLKIEDVDDPLMN